MKSETPDKSEGRTSRRKFLKTTAGTFVAASYLAAMGTGAIATQGVGQDPKIYVCPPCGQDCDKLEFDKPGKCPVCGMDLIGKAERDRMEAAAEAANQSPLAGSWAGTFFIGSPEHTAVRFYFTGTAEGLKGTV